MDTITAATIEERDAGSPLDGAIASFLTELQTAAYAKESVRNKRTVLRTFAAWLRRRHLSVDAIDESQIAAFLKRPSGTLPGRLKYKHAALSGFLKYLRGVGVISAPAPHAPSAGDDVLTEYVEYLRHDRGLAPKSLLVYVPFIRQWLRDQIARTGGVSMDACDAATIQRFLLDRTRDRSSEYARLLATALRSFFRFLFLRGHRPTDLASAVPTVCKYRNATVPAFLSPEDVDRVLAATDQSTPVGRRDYAIVLLLARLGLRAGEVAFLELDDIRWRTGELVIRGKGRVVEHLPLLADVGDALAQHLRDRRRASASRRVFLRSCPPHVGLSGPSVVGDIVCRRLADAKVQRARSRKSRKSCGIVRKRPRLSIPMSRSTPCVLWPGRGRRREVRDDDDGDGVDPVCGRPTGAGRAVARTRGHAPSFCRVRGAPRRGVHHHRPGVAVGHDAGRRAARDVGSPPESGATIRHLVARTGPAHADPSRTPPGRPTTPTAAPHLYGSGNYGSHHGGPSIDLFTRPARPHLYDPHRPAHDDGAASRRSAEAAASGRRSRARNAVHPGLEVRQVSVRPTPCVDLCRAGQLCPTTASAPCPYADGRVLGVRVGTATLRERGAAHVRASHPRRGTAPRHRTPDRARAEVAGCRHTCTTRTLVEWYRAGRDVTRDLPMLSTYLGHSNVAHTYWYIAGIPELLHLAADTLSGRRAGGGQ